MAFEIGAILHVSLIVADTQAALAFYQGVLGLRLDPSRPELGFPGVWLKAGEQQVHLLEVPNPDPIDGRPTHGGRDRHTAFAVRGLSGIQERLEQAGLPYTLSRSGRLALFVRDPDGNTLELIESR